MKLLITGGYGLLGTALRSIAIEDFEVLAPKRTELDLENYDEVSQYIARHKPDICVHAAARVSGLGGHKLFPSMALLVNSRIDINLISAFHENPPKQFVYVGTVASYGYPYLSNALKESDFFVGVPHVGEYGYAMAKRFGYDLSNSLKEKGCAVTYAVMTNLYGPNDNFNNKTGHVVPSLISRAFEASARGESLEVWGKLTDTRDFLSSDIAARRLIQTIDRGVTGLINIGSGVERSINSVVEIVMKEFNLNEMKLNKSPLNSISHRVLDISKLVNNLGVIEDNFESSLIETINWYKDNRIIARY